MISPVSQRWRDRRGTYRPAREPIRTRDYEVAAIADDTTPRRFVERHHYSGTWVAARFRVGLYRGGELVGVCVFSQPSSQAALDKALPLPCERAALAELGRLVLLDDVPANGESWFVARAFELAAREKGLAGIVSHSDPEPRTDAAGAVVFLGHIGTVYQALNATYCGRTNPSTKRLWPDGRQLDRRTIVKLNLRQRGYPTAVEQLIAFGAEPPRGDWRTWLADAIQTTTRPQRHHGTHRYVWALERRLRRHLPAGLAYPKFDGARAA